ncbi:3-isopropylmalate dehydratase small subunit [Pollutimonas subterranea]|uniref:3-isopropylmalate dehydratase small subunit n=1 Tax=Pollutimonas subterranea TaxID=2045210 RepID=A0A2N4U499_9BURK|nr:3-isopropylmalate dehydratase small subunit [Pollutimonas subterranea]PLC49848.1 3-isopropylmalate dehydratase small subunit [Pollutimonas subterranea]
MQPFVCVKGIAAAIEGSNIDTDQIIPGRFLKANRAKGYGSFLFHDLRYGPDGATNPAFILNREPFNQASVLITDDNFGCGSSREGAVYALQDFGVRALIGPSFGDIFYNNCLKNGIVPVRLDPSLVHRLREMLVDNPGESVEVDLSELRIVFPDGSGHAFDMDPFWRTCMLKGVDDLELSLSHTEQIASFIDKYETVYPWTRASGPGR